MRFKRKHRSGSLPEVNLVPMLDVLMTVLTFFIIVSMTLATQQGVQVQLPSNQPATPAEPQPEPLIVQMQAENQLLLNNQPIAKAELLPNIQAYLEKTPKGAIVLQADQKLSYEQVIQILGEMKDVGGDRVSLAIE
ncbi:biopolymer transporter ExbD [Leptolyngbya sp. FACHB-711]|uniref:ExbD/TolR family protein n=1 Tax=unclassified Leptolyngbya TaxID=2650499 RepID=UPI001682347D|nr:biopolymer transporter ExbD [Leptolyngbya sp. FACHB-711]MBD1850866.1 biopolymer transporter ExbD [Cyanobacteria bacterium FACHB-502]MBD2023994.1 biopolymer transporter ExbD [Leptolyngbya sp. FACHB-711]